MTNGSYCCMHCSGLLRGLHPPQRVKSISMSTFTNEEVERLKTLGNSINAPIYLGLYDGKKTFEPRIEEEVKAHLIEKYENRRWYVSPTDMERQKQLLEEHAAHRRDSLSAVSIHSQKSNQSAPPNLNPQQSSARSGPIDLLTGDLFDLSLSSTPVQPVPTLSNQQPVKTTELKSPQDEWADLFTKPITSIEPSTFPLNPLSTVPAVLQFKMPNIAPPKPKEHLAVNSASNSSGFSNQQQWESFVSMPKSATVGGINLQPPSTSTTANTIALDELFSNFDINKPNGQQNRPNDSLNATNFASTFDVFTSQQQSLQNNGSNVKTQHNTKATENWNPFLS